MDEQGVMVPATPQGGQLVPFGPSGEPLAIWFGWDISTARGKVLAINCRAGEDARVDSLIGKRINLWSAMAHPVEVEDEKTGELVQLVRVVIVDDKFNRFACASSGIWNDIRTLVAILGQPPWEPAIEVEVRQVATRKGQRVFKLHLTDEACKMLEARDKAARKQGKAGVA